MTFSTFLLDTAYFLGAAVIMVPLAKYLGLGSVLGYLAAGILIGPSGLGVIDEPEVILHFAEFGVVLLLFIIGLELNPRILWSMRRSILGIGGAQVFFSALLLCGLAWFLGFDWRTSLIAGMGLALSSTAIALKALEEKSLLPTPAGQAGFSVLLFQDIAVLPMLAILPMLAVSAVETAKTGWLPVVEAIAAIGLIVFIGPHILRPILRVMARAGLREVFTAFSLFLVIGVALLMKEVGLSMALGTFLVGVLLAESEYRHALEADIEPMKGLLMGLFFLAVGMSVDFDLLVKEPVAILGLTALLVIVKGLVLLTLARFDKLPKSQISLFIFLLAQGGEFAFVLFTSAVALRAMEPDIAHHLILIVTLSMLLNPLLLFIEERWIAPHFHRVSTPEYDEIETQQNPVIIAGFGRFGQVIGRLLHAHRIPLTLLDQDIDQIDYVRKLEYKIFFGDATRLDLLHAAGAKDASILVISLDNSLACSKLIEVARTHFPHLKIIARAKDLPQLFEYQGLGAISTHREAFDTALTMGEEVLRELGYPAFDVHRAGKRFRKHDTESLREIYAQSKKSPELGISAAIQARESLEKLFAEDSEPLRSPQDESWS
uniref:Glutathione-regulated potassium-efflux system ancillary protein KefC n=1 Tax=Candidatus Kentrum sp. SD TaxID=2126332 RepID=A0A450Z6I6_9GAMM|nr:MAG: glutathione-regulated potassium-efflux system ancillary protein KefC [Candidatus Kentron sp. SD]VFK49403.1 MAG: glutathione-regulated potassium-efflux system ancillary protein KefC [Candidatus Kentron sp. SD]VFK80888.1 MAG: glutathione-regulated potassium-efflux system ancillary protein KefC [Candidatus Kentron sp. SD]